MARLAQRAARAALDEDELYFLRQSLSTPCLAPIVRAEGAVLTDVEGKRIFDFHGNSVHQLGHGHPKVVDAIRREMETLPFSPAVSPMRPRRRSRGALLNGAGRPRQGPVCAERRRAISMALKLARYATGRHKTLSLWDSFHGANLDAISVGGEALFRRALGPMAPGAEHLPPLNLARRFFGEDKPFDRFADYIDYALEVQGDVSALIAEPMRWTTVEAPPPEFWPQVKDSCRRHGALLIFDEIPSCLARTGTLYACEQFGATPDILVIGKGLGGGIMPLAAILAPSHLDCAPDAAAGHYTHEKSPVACAAGLATLEVIEDEKLVERANALGQRGLERLHAMQARNPVVRDVRGLGCYFGIEIGGDDSAGAAEQLMYRCLKRGLSFKIGGGNVVTLCPPLTIPFEQFDEALSIFEDAISALES